LQKYGEQGFIVLRGVFSQSEMREASKEIKMLREKYDGREAKVTGESLVVTEAGTGVLKSFFCPHLKAPATLKKIANSPPLFEIAQQILADEVYIHQSRINFQSAIVGTGFKWHSDFETWHNEDGMPKPRAVSAVIMCAKNRPYNGALMVYPGSHKHFVRVKGMQPDRNWEDSLSNQTYGSPDQSQLAYLAELGRTQNDPIMYLEGDPGDVIFFDSNLMHGSHGNISHESRTNVFQVFNAASNNLVEPFAGTQPRPEHLAHRTTILSSKSVLSQF